MRGLASGDKVVYQKPKTSSAPGPRAADVRPRAQGEDYEYVVDKFWLVTTVPDSSHVEVITRRGKRHVLAMSDPRLRRANPLERWFYRDRFPEMPSVEVDAHA